MEITTHLSSVLGHPTIDHHSVKARDHEYFLLSLSMTKYFMLQLTVHRKDTIQTVKALVVKHAILLSEIRD